MLGPCVRETSADPKRAFLGRGQMKHDDAEVARLKRELAKITAERNILKNYRLLHDGAAMRFRFIAKYRGVPVSWLCAALAPHAVDFTRD